MTLHPIADFVSCLTDNRLSMPRHFPMHGAEHLGKHQADALLFTGVHRPKR